MASIADIVTEYQSARKAYENAVFRVRDFAGEPWTGHSLEIASKAVTAAANAVQAARLAAEARDKLGFEMTERLLEAACAAATFAADAAKQACGLTLDAVIPVETDAAGKAEISEISRAPATPR